MSTDFLSLAALVPTDPVAEAVAHFGLDVAQLRAPAESYSSTVRLITLASGERFVLKIPYSRVKLLREMMALRALQADLPVPEVIDVWVPEGDGPGALLLSHLPGAPIEGPIDFDLAREMGEVLATLHAHRLCAFGEIHVPSSGDALGWWEMMHERFGLWVRTAPA